MKTKNTWAFKVLTVIVWIIFVGLSIEAAGLIVNFVVSLYRPEFVANLYQKLDLSEMHARSEGVFFRVYNFILFIAILKALLFYRAAILVTKMDMKKPFNAFVSRQIALMSYYAFALGILSYLGQEYAQYLLDKGYDMNPLVEFWNDSEAFVLMALVLHVIATIFKKGLELQDEKDLTI